MFIKDSRIRNRLNQEIDSFWDSIKPWPEFAGVAQAVKHVPTHIVGRSWLEIQIRKRRLLVWKFLPACQAIVRIKFGQQEHTRQMCWRNNGSNDTALETGLISGQLRSIPLAISLESGKS